ncbi:hypothetical protein OF83DRAFT_637566 [Amylostereum chailletii]|nr:hypothetical protein OF83DRAFT_637566 [Amylostereum chailletii]
MTFNPVHSVAVVKASADMGLVNTISLLLRSGLAHKIRSKFLSVSTILDDLHTVHTLPGVSPVNQVRQGDELLCDIVNMYLSRQDKWAGEDKAVLQTVFKE